MQRSPTSGADQGPLEREANLCQGEGLATWGRGEGSGLELGNGQWMATTLKSIAAKVLAGRSYCIITKEGTLINFRKEIYIDTKAHILEDITFHLPLHLFNKQFQYTHKYTSLVSDSYYS